jgi:hypothetical protein
VRGLWACAWPQAALGYPHNMANKTTKPRTSGKHKHPVCRIPATHAQREAWARAAHGQPFSVHARDLLDRDAEEKGIEIAEKIGEDSEEE